MSMSERRTVTRELARLKMAPLRSAVPPTPWARDAACQSHDPELWMEDKPGPATAAAKAVCAGCPVRAACLAHALHYDEAWGIWGGKTPRERVSMKLRAEHRLPEQRAS